MRTALILLAVRFLAAAGCGGEAPPEEMLPACDTQRSVFFVKTCLDPSKAQCALFTTAPAGAMATECYVGIVNASTGEARKLECVEGCP